MLLPEVLVDTLKSVSGDVDFAELFLETTQTNAISLEDDKVERVVSGQDQGVGVRILKGENTKYAYTNNLTAAGLKETVSLLRQIGKREKGEVQLDLVRKSAPYELTIEQYPAQVAMARKADVVKRANKAARGVDARVKQVTVTYQDFVQKVTIANTEGLLVEDERVNTRFFVNVVARENELIQTGFEHVGGFSGFELFDERSVEDVALAAAKRSLLALKAKLAPTGTLPVVLASQAGGTMIHEAIGHSLEADHVQKGLSQYANKLGEKVASPLVTVVDDATLPKGRGSFRFDDEGKEGENTVLIENGILKGYLHDYLTSRKDKVSATGNGRRQSYQFKPIPRMSNTYILPGSRHKPEEIVKSVSKGLYVKKMGGGQVNVVNGDFVFEVEEAYLIEKGEVTFPVRGATLTGNGPAALKLIEAVGDDLGFAAGTCGKAGQYVPVSDGQPTVLIRELIIGGTAK